ncbi:unnamed protein product [Acanthoscelides obtectus]|uniref:THAP-type domain-containing protein n=1 Tax=Acanthoscelides obtectus TaxID=200917 RepID=A0A9P0KQU9_ACAOB|nr:unnamed protein product [Acanthoscelides obtectus]CAK1681489.1 hypothetical protein AOBTE_LOCUS33143 [Acanthoscelides obtectus]
MFVVVHSEFVASIQKCFQVVLAAIIALLSLIDNFQRQWDVGSAFFVELAVKKLRQPSTGFLVKKKQEEWWIILNIDINDLPLHASICANHFHKSDLIEGKRTQLKHSAVPSVEPLRQTDDSSDEENEINLAQEIAL